MSATYTMLAKEIQPGVIAKGRQCGAGSCPVVCQRQDGQLVIVGKRLAPQDQSEFLASGMAKIYDDECAVLVNPVLILEAMQDLAK